MKFLEEFWDAVKGNSIARVRDPIIGTFIVSWLLCNWYEVTLLFFGNGKVWERIDRLNLYLTANFENNCIQILMLPIIITFFYLFIFPRVSLIVKNLQKTTNDKLYSQAFEITKSKAEKNVELNIELLKSDQNKEFLSELVKVNINEKKTKLQLLQQEEVKVRLANDLKEEELKKSIAETKVKELNAISEKNAYEIEKEKYEIISAKNKVEIANARFPFIYSLLSSLSENLEESRYFLPFKAHGDIISYLFGYENFNALLDDKKFSNKIIGEVLYIYLNYKDFSDFLISIVDEGVIISAKMDDDHLFGIIGYTLEKYNIKLINGEMASEMANELFESEVYNLIHRGDISALLVEYDIDDPDFHVDEISNAELSNEMLIVNISIIISGSHRLDENFHISDVKTNLVIFSPVIVGSNALGEFKIENTYLDY